jgi:hypothetical protein
MAFADDLLEQAYHLANRDSEAPSQANLRRSVSTAYYALFHLLIEDAVGKWSVERQRSAIGRTFEHKVMKTACQDFLKDFYTAGKPESLVRLKEVAKTFSVLQEDRNLADYDISLQWLRSDAITEIDLASRAFEHWRAIRLEDAAQDFLLNLFFPRAADRLKAGR